MARISGTNLPAEKRSEIGLTYIVGIGRSLSKAILTEVGIDFDKKIKDLTEEEVSKIRDIIALHPTEADLRRLVALNIKRLQEIGSYRGYRHKRGLPVRGQKTKTNARTRKGRKKTIANKKK